MPNEFVARNGVIALNNSTVTGSLNVTSGITGSLFGTASWAQNFITSSVTSASYSQTASFLLGSVTSASFASTASLLLGLVTSASYALTASYALNAANAVATSGDKITTGSVTASVDINGDTFTLISGSSTFLFVSSSGNVGVNTTSSTAQLEVRKSAQTKPNIILSGPNNFNAGDFRGLAITNYYSDATLTNKQLAIYNADSINYPYLRVSIANLNYVSVDVVTGSTAGAKDLYVNNAIYITSGSNVGIGTLVPAAKLQVSGSSNVVNFRGSGSVATSSIFTVDGAAGRLFSVNDSLSGSLFSVNTIAGLPVMEAFSDNTVRIGQYGQKVLFISQSRVGIGTETPTALLHITSSTGNIFEVDGSGSIAALSVSSSGRVGISTDTPAGRFDIAFAGLLNNPTILLGADDTGGTTRTNLTTKNSRIAVAHHNNSATASTVLTADSNATDNRVFIGGGTSYLNAATQILFYTGPTTASLQGTEQMKISGSGQIIVSSSVSISGSLTVTTGSIKGNINSHQLIYSIVNSNPSVNQNDFAPVGWNDADPAKATTIDISGSSSIKITGLAGGAHGRIAVLRNTSPDRIIILEDNATSSLSQNRFDFRNPIFLVPNATIQLQYDSSSSRWEPIGSSGGIGFQGFFDQYEEFLGYNVVSSSSTNNAGLWTGVASGAFSSIGTSSYLQNTTERPLGIYDMNVGSTAAGRAHIGTRTSASIQPGYGQAIMLTRVALQQAATAAENFQVFAGWHDSITGGGTTRGFPTKGVYWMYNSGSGAPGSTWQAVAASASLSSSATVGPTIDTNYNWLGIYINSQWNRATWFYSTDSVTWFIAQDAAPAGSTITGSQIGFGVTAVKAIGTTGRLITLDVLAHRYDTNRN